MGLHVCLRGMFTWLLLCWIAAQTAAAAPTTAQEWLVTLRESLPTLQHGRGDRWPLVLWQGLGYHPLTDEQIDMLLARGVVQHLRPEQSMLPAARTLQQAGAPIVLMAGSSGSWPYDLAGDPGGWAHRYPADADVPPHWRRLPSPPRFAGWAVAADNLRTTMTAFRDAGVAVDAVWLDYEGEPSTADFRAASRAVAAAIPRPALASESAFHGYRRQLWSQLLSAYVAAPIREVFPQISVTNWVQTVAAGPCAVLDWHGRPHPVIGPTLFTATNPVAYGIDTAFRQVWTGSAQPSREMADWIYLHILLRQVSADACNRAHGAPYLPAIAWVARRVVDDPARRTPAMSRAVYREALRHLWLRGVSAMQVFNPYRPASPELALEEIVDAQRIYDEMLYFRSLLNDGRVMSTDQLDPAAPGVLWSGVIGEAAAVVRVVNYSGIPRRVTVATWAGEQIELPAVLPGRTFLVERRDGDLKVKRCRRDTGGVACE